MIKAAPEHQPEHIEAKAGDLELIRTQTQRDLSADDVYLVRQKLANDRYDRAHERFPVEYLERFAHTLPKKSLLIGHDYGKAAIGRYYKASVQQDEQGHYLDAFAYLDAQNPEVRQIELGIWRDVSIGYNAGKRVCDLCEKAWSPYGGKDGCEHWPGADSDGKTCTLTYCPTEAHKAEAMEGSFVWAGCQYGAEAVPKSADGFEPNAQGFLMWMAQRFQHGPEGANGMPTIEEVQAELQQTKAAHQTEAAKWREEQAELKKQAADGEWGRSYLAAEIVRMAGVLGEGDYYGTMLKMLGEHPTVDQLEPLWKMVGEKFDVTFPQVRAQIGGAPGPEDVQRTQTVAVPWFRRRTA